MRVIDGSVSALSMGVTGVPSVDTPGSYEIVGLDTTYEYVIAYAAGGNSPIGFFGGAYGLDFDTLSYENETAAIVTLDSGANELSFSTSPTSKFSGKVTDVTGKPLAGTRVIFYRFDGTKWAVTGGDTTGATGTYALFGVQPGTYKVGFDRMSDVAAPLPTEVDYPISKYLPAFSGGASTLETASVFSVSTPGSFVANAKLVVGGSLSGSLDDASDDGQFTATAYRLAGTPLNNYDGGIVRASTMPDGGYQSTATGVDGKWMIPGLPTGYYVVKFRDNDFDHELDAGYPDQFVGGASWSSATPFAVTIGKNTLAGVVDLASTDELFAPTSLAGSVNQPARVSLVALDESNVTLTKQLESVGGFAFSRIAPGTYSVLASPQSDSFLPIQTVIEVESGEVEQLTLDFEPNPAGFSFTSGFELESSDLQVGSTVTVVSPTTFDDHVELTRSYKWFRDGALIFGARGDSYQLRAADLGATISARVQVFAPGYYDNPFFGGVFPKAISGLVSATTPVVPGEAPTLTEDPQISYSGALKAGTTITASTGRWNVAGASYSFEWTRGGTVVSTKPSYVVAKGDANRILTVKVTASKAGFTSAASGTAEIVIPLIPVTVKTAAKVTSKTVGSTTTYTVTPQKLSVAGSQGFVTWYIDGAEAATGPTFSAPVAPGAALTAVSAQFGPNDMYVASYQTLVARRGAAPTASTDPFVFEIPGFGEPRSAADSLVAGTELSAALVEWIYPTEVQRALKYQWLRDSKPIAGATKSRYTVVALDAAHTLTVRITATTPAYATATQVFPVDTVDLRTDLLDDEPTVTIAGTGAPTTVLRASSNAWSLAGVTTGYAWSVCRVSVTPGCDMEDFVAIPGATKATFTPTASYANDKVRVKALGSKLGYATGSSFSEPLTIPAANVFAIVTPAVVSGIVDTSARVGTPVKVTAPKWDVAGVATTVRWLTCTLPCSEPATLVGVGTSYTPTLADLNANKQLRATVTGTKAGYLPFETTVVNEQIEAGFTTVKKAPTVKRSGQTFTVSATILPAGGTYDYIWTVDGEFASSGSPSFTLASGHALSDVRVMVAYSVDGYQTKSFQLSAQVGAAPMVVFPEIHGSTFGDLLDVETHVTWPNGGSGDEPTYRYQWLANGKAIKGATASTLWATTALLDKAITVRVTASSQFYATAVGTSEPLWIVRAEGPQPLTGSSIATSGEGAIVPGVKITFAAPRYDLAGMKYAYQWFVERDGVVTSIPKATKAAYTATAADVGGYLSVRATVTKPGYLPIVVERDVDVVYVTADITVVTLPVVTGSGAVGTTLSATKGTWNVAGAKVAYQWFRNGSVIPGATAATLALVSDNLDNEIWVEVSATKLGFGTGRVVANSVTVTAGAAPTATARPTLSGTFAGGGVVTATPGTWSIAGLEFSFAWSLDGVPTGATGSTYEVDPADAGKKLSVVVTTRGGGRLAGTATSLGLTVSN
jgi:hypothetical protein